MEVVDNIVGKIVVWHLVEMLFNFVFDDFQHVVDALCKFLVVGSIFLILVGEVVLSDAEEFGDDIGEMLRCWCFVAFDVVVFTCDDVCILMKCV